MTTTRKFPGFEISVSGLDYFLTSETSWQYILLERSSGKKFLSIVVKEDARTEVKTVLLVPAEDGEVKTAFANGQITFREFIERSGTPRIGHLDSETGVIGASPVAADDIPSDIMSCLEHKCDFVKTKEWYDRRMARFASRFA